MLDKYLPYLPYAVTVICALISGFASFFAARKQAKSDIQKLEKQYSLDLEKEREKFEMEKEKLEIEHRHQLELKQKELENQLGTEFMSTVVKEYIRSPAGKEQMRKAGESRRR